MSQSILPVQTLKFLKKLDGKTSLEIQDILESLTKGMKYILGEQLVGLYLTGSLSYGDFNIHNSDIDFIAVMNSPMNPEQRKMLAELHDEVGGKYPAWEKRVDGSYLTQDMFTTLDPPKTPRPFVNGGEFRNPDPIYGENWSLDIYNLRSYGLTLYGLEPVRVFPNVGIERVVEASLKDLKTRWTVTAKKPKPFEREGYDSSHLQAYAILTMCRKLHDAKLKRTSSKKAASLWAKQVYPEWKNLIEIAEAWEHGQTLHEEEQVRDFINFTIDKLQ